VSANWGYSSCGGSRDYQLTVTNNTSLRIANGFDPERFG